MSALARAQHEVRVGIGDLGMGQGPEGTVVTHALGSCVGVFAFHPISRLGACLHYMLPKNASQEEPYKFADTGLPLLIRSVSTSLKEARPLRLVACGGATLQRDVELFRIGQRNVAALRAFLWKHGLLLAAEDLGGEQPRTARLDLQSGLVTVTSNGSSTVL
jgi:chemotaxis protein CheD